MANKLTEFSALIILFIPVIVAVASVIIKFNIVDFVYLVLVGIIFLNYFIKTRKQSWSFLVLFIY